MYGSMFVCAVSIRSAQADIAKLASWLCVSACVVCDRCDWMCVSVLVCVFIMSLGWN